MAQGSRQIVAAEGAALFAEQCAGLQRLQQGLQHRMKARWQPRPISGRTAERATQGAATQAVVFIVDQGLFQWG
ncbi:MAG: hypothetical protein EBT24_03875 [Betaproteobacteria bacterium]|nr:hypothetical protein [Betaproteobacteria bacterium]